jgi:UDPglucose 6-dehydrogenase
MIGFIGLSHLGLNYSLATAAKGFDIIGYDPDSTLVEGLRSGRFPIEEPGFKELFAAHGKRIRFTSDLADLRDCTLVFFSLDIPTNERNESDLSRLDALIEKTVPALSKGATAVVLSQVRPGYMRALLDRAKLSPETWFYQVETLVFGAAVKRAMEPERYIIGAAVPTASLPVPYDKWLSAFECPRLVMRYESAELAKIAINLFLVSTVSTTNTLAEICEAIGADWAEIAPAMKFDRRIGPYAYLKPGLGIAGGNLERDLVTVKSLAKEFGTEVGIVDAWQRNSSHAKSWALRTLQREVLSATPGARIALWGLAYKQDTHSVKNSAAIELIRALTACTLHGYDPRAHVDRKLFANLRIVPTAMEALSGADALVIMTPWNEFSEVAPASIRTLLKGKTVIDPYGMLNADACAASGLRLFQIGSPS